MGNWGTPFSPWQHSFHSFPPATGHLYRQQTLLGGEMMGVSMRPLPQTPLMSGKQPACQEHDRKEAVKGAAQKYQALLDKGRSGRTSQRRWLANKREAHPQEPPAPRSRAPSSLLRRSAHGGYVINIVEMQSSPSLLQSAPCSVVTQGTWAGPGPVSCQ